MEFTPKQVLKLWDDYKESVNKDLDGIEKATNKGVQTEHTRPPYLRTGFEAYVYRKKGKNIHQYIDNYKDLYKDYVGVVRLMRNEWESDQVGGTMTGRYKAQTLTARLNGYVDKKEIVQEVELKIPKMPDIGNRK